jgi:hypothetical protein
MPNQASHPSNDDPQPELNPLDLLEELQRSITFTQFGGVSMSDLYAQKTIVQQLLALNVPGPVIDSAIILGQWEGDWIFENQVLTLKSPNQGHKS